MLSMNGIIGTIQNTDMVMVTNSTYIEDFDLWDDEKSLKENFQTWLECI